MKSTRRNHFYKHGFFTGYTDYRYGSQRPISLADLTALEALTGSVPETSASQHETRSSGLFVRRSFGRSP